MRRRKRTALRASRKKASYPYIPIYSDEVLLAAPECICLSSEWHSSLALFLQKIRGAFKAGSPICIDFRATKLVVAPGMILLYSEISRIIDIDPGFKIRCIPARDDVVNQVFKHLGFYTYFDFSSDAIPVLPSVVSWKYASSAVVDGDSVGELLLTYESLKPASRHVYAAATEAMINSVDHAYSADRADGLPKPSAERWRLFCREDDGKIVIAVCDLGVGIPNTLPINFKEIIEGLFGKSGRGRVKSDARIIEAAMEIGRSRYETMGRKGRGKGFYDMRRLVDEVGGATLQIYSNRGYLMYMGGQYSRRNFDISIMGTVVVWIIPVGR